MCETVRQASLVRSAIRRLRSSRELRNLDECDHFYWSRQVPANPDERRFAKPLFRENTFQQTLRTRRGRVECEVDGCLNGSFGRFFSGLQLGLCEAHL
jgi:hypothetical protein